MIDKINVVNSKGRILKTITRKRWLWADGDYRISYNGMWYKVKTCPEKPLPETKNINRFYITLYEKISSKEVD